MFDSAAICTPAAFLGIWERSDWGGLSGHAPQSPGENMEEFPFGPEPENRATSDCMGSAVASVTWIKVSRYTTRKYVHHFDDPKDNLENA